ncbi:MAG TPA: cupredoxin domain-containing protein [Acidimicrobiia bacterium]|nr:cupredoxin domain-containing protein [Acidimicrobiia bacterium]
MQRKAILIAGLIALAASLIGPAVQAMLTDDARWPGQMFGHGHMGWWGEGQTTGDVIEGASETEVTATEFAFSPDELTVMVGEAVNLTLINAGDLPHDLVIPDLGVRLAVGPGGQATTGVEVDRAGSYQFLCSYPGHAEAGMTGLLTVNPNP